MALTYRQKTLEVKRGLREAQKARRTLETSLEKVDRELNRLISRKTLVGPDSLVTLLNLWDKGVRQSYPAAEKALSSAISNAAL